MSDRPNALSDPPSLSLGHSGPKRGGRELTKEGDGRGNTGRGGGGAPPKQAGTQHQGKEERNGEKRFDPPSVPWSVRPSIPTKKEEKEEEEEEGKWGKKSESSDGLNGAGRKREGGRGKKSD